MKVSILVILIVLPMLASIGLYCYSFISARWSYIDEELIEKYNRINIQKRLQQNYDPNNIQLQSQLTRHAFRSRYGLFGYCLDYRWINLLIPKSLPTNRTDYRLNLPLFCRPCEQGLHPCPDRDSNRRCCMTPCDYIPDCPSYIDEQSCNRPYNETRYYWPEGNCIWHSTWVGNQPLPSYLSSSSYESNSKEFHTHVKRIRYYIMFLLFTVAPLLIFLALLIIFCINCVERFYSIPFAFVSFISFASFISGAGGVGIFLYEWVQDRSHRPDYTYQFGQREASVIAFNPWLINVEQFGLAFWLIIAAVSTTLLTTILSCCFCCGLQSEKSKLRFHVDNDVYEIVQMTPYDD